MPIDPDECRQHALECGRMAQTTKDSDAGKYGLTSPEHGWSSPLILRGPSRRVGHAQAKRQKNFLIVGSCTSKAELARRSVVWRRWHGPSNPLQRNRRARVFSPGLGLSTIAL